MKADRRKDVGRVDELVEGFRLYVGCGCPIIGRLAVDDEGYIREVAARRAHRCEDFDLGACKAEGEKSIAGCKSGK